LAHSSNFSLLIPGILAVTVSWDLVITPSSKVIAHLVSISSGVNPAAWSTKPSFMLKQPACAAAISSSGLVPGASSNLDLEEYFALLSTLLWVLRVPCPSLPEPCHTAVAFLIIFLFFIDES